MKFHLIALTWCVAATLVAGDAAALTGDRAIELVQFCAEKAGSRRSVEQEARQQRWWRLDDGTLNNLRDSTRLAQDDELGWLADREGAIVTLGTEGARLDALGDPLETGARELPAQACTVYATRTDPDQIMQGIEAVQIFGASIGPAHDVTEVGDRRFQFWILRSGDGEIAYVYAEFGNEVAAVEVGRLAEPQ